MRTMRMRGTGPARPTRGGVNGEAPPRQRGRARPFSINFWPFEGEYWKDEYEGFR
jgi:hypothetical protein